MDLRLSRKIKKEQVLWGKIRKKGKVILKEEIKSSKRRKKSGEESGHSCVGQIRSSEDFIIIGSWSCLVDLHSPVHLKLSLTNHITNIMFI